MTIIVNLGGEGEQPDAINVNLFYSDNMLDLDFANRIDENLVIRASAHQTGLDDESVDVVVANRFPIQLDEFIIDEMGQRAHIALLAIEAFRILKSGGTLSFDCASCDRLALARAFERAGLISVTILPNRRIVGKKP